MLQRRRKTLRSITRIKLCLVWVTLVLAVFAWALAVCSAEAPQDEKTAGKKPNSNANTLCYVCHLDLQTEEIAAVHLEKAITCDKCHGPSTRHIQDEMLMTKPDLLFGRAEVDGMCGNCHQDHKDPQAVETFRKKWLGRTRPNGRAITQESVCTDCHGTHNIIKQMGTKSQGEQPAEWVPAFNGRNLAGWRPSGAASWTVKRSCIIAATGPNGQDGDLWTNALYQDYLLSLTFRAEWPIHAGIWLRAADDDPGPRIEIFDSRKPLACTGSILVHQKGLALANLREDLVDKEGWNTISVKVQGDRIQVWLNAEEIGAVRTTAPTKGKIGLHIEGRQASKTAELCVREVLIQQLGRPQEN